jgi:hypothetical protein
MYLTLHSFTFLSTLHMFNIVLQFVLHIELDWKGYVLNDFDNNLHITKSIKLEEKYKVVLKFPQNYFKIKEF